MVICVAVDCKSNTSNWKAKVSINFQGTKIGNSNGSKTECRNIQSIEHVRICHAYCFR